jgi:very-short-patch-repair endonuclease
VVTHESALRVHGLDCVPAKPFTFTIPHGAHSRVAGPVVHQIDDLRPHHVVRANGLPVTKPARAVVEVAAVLGRRRLRRVLDDVLLGHLAKLPQIAACLREVMRPGKPGVRKLAEILDDRSNGYIPPQSELERALLAALAVAGLPEPRRQFPLPGRGDLEGLVDAAYPDAQLIIEADGRRWHTRLDDFATDRRRDREAARVGWQTIRFVYDEIMYDPAGVGRQVAEIRAERLRARK